MNSFANRSHESYKRRAWLLTIAAGSLLFPFGCGIPNLRHAQPGPTLPPNYDRPHTASNDEMAGHELVESSGGEVLVHQASNNEFSSNTATSSPLQVVGYLRQANAINLDDAIDKSETDSVESNTMGQTKPSKQASNLIESDVSAVLDSFSGASQFDSFDRANSLENSVQIGWQGFFDDPYLIGLIDLALTDNQELKILAEEIQIACNETYARSGEYRPFVSLGARAGIEKSGRHTRNGAVEEQLDVASGKAFPDPLPNFLVGTNVSWELDIWKRLRNAQGAAAMRYLATQEGRNYVVTRLVAEVAENYYELLALDNRLATLNKTITIQEASLKTADSMKEAGRGTELAVQRFQAEVRKNQSEKLIIEQEIIETENRINFLVGRYPQRVDRASVEYIDLDLRAISAGVPSQLLQNRPDIRESERELQAAGLDIKVAKARFYPSLNLSAGLGYEAFSAGYLFRTPESLIYGIGGDLIAPLVNKLAIQAAYRTANARQLQAVYDYQRTVLNAYTEVINQLTKVDNYGKSIEIKKQQLAALEASVDSATKLFQNARAEYVEVLLAQREMMEAKMLIIEIKQQQLAATVNTYQALGGGSAQSPY